MSDGARIPFVVNARTGTELKAGNRDSSRVFTLLTDPNLGMCDAACRPIQSCETKQIFQAALDQLLHNWKAADQLLFYFSGHGHFRNGVYRLQVGQQPTDSVPFINILTDLNSAGVCRAILILDACHSGGALGEKGEFCPVSKDEIPTGIVIMASSQFSEKSYELPDKSGSVFTKLLCDAIDSGLDGTSTHDGYINVDDIMHYVGAKLKEAPYSNYPQTPVYSVNYADRAIWMAKNKTTRSDGRRQSDRSEGSAVRVRSLEELELAYRNTVWSRQPCEGPSIVDVDWELAEGYRKTAHPALDMKDREQLLAELGLFSPLSRKQLHRAAVLCFCQRPETHLPQAISIFTVGNVAAAQFTRREVVGPLSRQIEQLCELTRAHVPKTAALDGGALRREEDGIPAPLVREIISNAVAHRDYTMPGHIQVRVMAEALEVQSPGAFPHNASWESWIKPDTVQESDPRDQAIALYLARLFAFESVGRGFLLVREHLAQNGPDSITCHVSSTPTMTIRVKLRPPADPHRLKLPHEHDHHVGFKYTSKFEEELSDVGAPFTHPGKSVLTIDDIYVHPDLREYRTVPERGGHANIIRSKLFVSELVKRRKVVIYGEEDSGKSCLARAWVRALLEQDIKPIYVNAREFFSNTKEDAITLLGRRCALQYGADKCEEFAQLDVMDKALIIDDFDKLHRSGDEVRQLLSLLDANFGTIVVFGDQIMRLNDISHDNPLAHFHKFEILPFGYELRYSIVERWFQIGRNAGLDARAMTRRINEATVVLNSALGGALVPSYPIFLLIILQQLEAISFPAGGTHSSRSSGYFYDVLITRALAKVQDMGLDLDTSFSYLAELAHWMYDQRIRCLSHDELRRRHEAFCEDYRLQLNFDRLVDFFVEASVLRRDSEQYEFRYDYLYYYSIAYSLRGNSRRLEACLPKLISTIYTEESAGIIVFVMHLSRDERIVNSILGSARSLYADVKPCNLREDVAFLRALSHEPPRLMLPESTTRENRVTMLRENDNDEEERRNDKQEDDRKSREGILRLNVAFKTIQILGGYLRTYPGSTKGALKLTVARECYLLGLRALSQLLKLIADNREPLKDDIEKWLRVRGVNPAEVGGRATGMIWWLSEALTLTLILRTADAVGMAQLRRTYDEIVAEDESVGVRMIDLAVRLEHLPGFPEAELFALKKSVHRDSFVLSILTRLVYRHFYLYETSYKLRQRVCASLDIGLPTQRPGSVFPTEPPRSRRREMGPKRTGR